MRATIADIASALGCSKSTVSIGLRNDPRLPEETRRRIRETALRLGYRPDPALASIAAQRWRRTHHDAGLGVALLSCRRETGATVREAYLHHAHRRLGELGYHATRFDLDDQPTAAATNRILIARGIRGLLIPPVFDESLLTDIELSRFSLSAAGMGQWRPPAPLAMIDVFEAVLLSLRTMIARGYRRIGVALLRHPGTVPDDMRRLGAFHFARDLYSSAGVTLTLWERGLQPVSIEIESFLEWFRTTQPEALLGLNEFALTWLRNEGVKTPPDFGYASLNRHGEWVRLAGIDPQHQRIGEEAAELLDQEIRQHRVGAPALRPPTMLIPPTWVDGSSLPGRSSRGRAKGARLA